MCENARNSISEKFRNLDTFGSPIALNYHGSDAYKTKMGAFASLLVTTLGIYTLVTRGYEMIFGINPEFISYEVS